MAVSRHIAGLISQGEGLTLDFKHSITDSRKIARSLVAFANTAGGTLLIGVKDNGNIAGVNTDEEYYMVEAASQLYCKPEVPFEVVKWEINGKTVLEVKVKPSKHKPHKAPDKSGNYKAYIRVNDENVVASPIQLKIWKAERSRKPINIVFGLAENTLIDYLKLHKTITISHFSRLGFISISEAERILVDLTAMGLIEYSNLNNEDHFSLRMAE
ncbi:MAG TPA: ATP-binding protein [Bacteroidales bacterium]|nr:ATP-binding protein [Bacteroidales bacterium]